MASRPWEADLLVFTDVFKSLFRVGNLWSRRAQHSDPASAVTSPHTCLVSLTCCLVMALRQVPVISLPPRMCPRREQGSETAIVVLRTVVSWRGFLTRGAVGVRFEEPALPSPAALHSPPAAGARCSRPRAGLRPPAHRLPALAALSPHLWPPLRIPQWLPEPCPVQASPPCSPSPGRARPLVLLCEAPGLHALLWARPESPGVHVRLGSLAPRRLRKHGRGRLAAHEDVVSVFVGGDALLHKNLHES